MQIDRRLISLLRTHYLALSIPVAAGFLGGVLVVIQARFLSSIISAVYLHRGTLQSVYPWLVFLLIIIVFRGILIWTGSYSASRLAIKIKTDLRTALYDHLNQLGLAYFQRGSSGEPGNTGELVQVSDQGIEALQAYFGQYIPQLALAVLVPLTVLIFILPLDLLSGVILLATAPLIPIFMVLIGDRAKLLTERQWITLSRMSAYFLDVIQGLGTLKAFGRSREQIKIINQIGERYRETTMGVLRVTFLSALALEWLAMLSTAIIAVEISLRLLYGRLDFQQAFFILILAPEFYLPLRLLGSRFHAGMAGVTAASRIFSILDSQPAAVAASSQPTRDRQVSLPAISAPLSVEFVGVHCAYQHNREVLSGVTFKLAPGELTALVGPSGAGKTTLVELLLGFQTAEQGQIWVNQQPLQAIPEQEWLSQIAWVSQDPYIFDTSVLENIRMARPGASESEVITAAKNAYAHDFILQLPEGYHTRVGERGSRLSAGQAQRLALARAFLKDSSLLILDEATANLDPHAAGEIQAALTNLIPGHTILVIAHNLETVRSADQIIVLSGGLVVAQGKHTQLEQSSRLYQRMLSGEIRLPAIPASAVKEHVEPHLLDLLPVDQTASESSAELSFASLRSLLSWLTPFKWLVLIPVLLGWATVLSGVGLLATSAYLISAAALQPSIALLQVPIVAVRAFGISRGLFRYLERCSSHDNTFKLINRLRVRFYQALEPLAPARLQDYHSGDLLNRIRLDLHALENFYLRVFSPALVWILVTSLICALLSVFSIQLGLTLLAFQLIAGLIIPILVRSVSHHPEAKLIQHQATLSAALVDGIQGIAELKIFDASSRYRNKFLKINQAIAAVQSQIDSISSSAGAIETTLAYLASWTILLLAIPLVSSGQVEGVFLAALVLATLTSFEAAQLLPQAAQALERGLSAANRLEEIVSLPAEITDPDHPYPAPAGSQVEFVGLDFAYPAPKLAVTPGFALKDIRFTLPAGKKVAVVGPSGAGKTTLANLLMRFWDYHGGKILLADLQLKGYCQEDARGQFAFVSQQSHFFNSTLADNLRLAKPGASQQELVTACENAQLGDFIASLPQGFDTWIGEGGARLSAGERQRLAIARALLKDAPVLILDEPTAHLDPLTGRKLVESLFENYQDRSILWITHRLAGMEAMDEILVIDSGQIVERGQHQDLLDRGGLYLHMWNLQHQAF
ncbi:MAG: thiol reductant ABC exporter subunit CydD [Anaerolineales bacterium]